MAENFDLESLVHLEQAFYDAGYEDGFAHGQIHGLIEGRAMGNEKGFEMWEELGFYEGFALTWRVIYTKQGRKDDRAIHHIRHLLELISQFPRVNPSASSSEASPDLDISKLLRQIQSRYKALCATLGVRPRLRASEAASSQDGDDPVDLDDTNDDGLPKAKSIWKLEDPTRRTVQQGLSF